jgi:hypothetical protein
MSRESLGNGGEEKTNDRRKRGEKGRVEEEKREMSAFGSYSCTIRLVERSKCRTDHRSGEPIDVYHLEDPLPRPNLL